MALEFPPLAVHVQTQLADELAAVSTEALCLSLPTLVALRLLGITHLLQGILHLKQVLDVEGGGQAGHAPLGERGRLAAVGARCTEPASLCHHKLLQTGLAEDVQTGQHSGLAVLLETHRARQLVRQLLHRLVCCILRFLYRRRFRFQCSNRFRVSFGHFE